MKTSLVKNLCQYCLVVFLACGSSAFGQSYGTVNLPRWLADSGVTVQRAATSTPKLTQWTEGPIVSKNGTVFCAEQNTGNIWKISAAGVMTKLVTVTNSYVNGMDFNPINGNLVVCEKAQITERDTSDGHVIKVVTTATGTAWGQGANDLTFAANGDMFFTCWNQHIFFHKADSSVNKDWDYTTQPTCNWNGIEYIEEKGIIYLNQYGQNKVLVFKVDSATHFIDTSSKKTFASVPSPDGITVDSLYNVYVACNSSSGTYPYSIVTYDSSGTVLGSIHLIQKLPSTSSSLTNCVFGNFPFGGGLNPKTLYLSGDSGIFTVQLKVPGRVRTKLSPVALKQQGNDYLHSDAANKWSPGFSVISSGAGFQIKSNTQSDALFSVYSLSGRCFGVFPVVSQSTFFWRPPACGTYIVRMSNNRADVTKKILYGF